MIPNPAEPGFFISPDHGLPDSTTQRAEHEHAVKPILDQNDGALHCFVATHGSTIELEQ